MQIRICSIFYAVRKHFIFWSYFQFKDGYFLMKGETERWNLSRRIQVTKQPFVSQAMEKELEQVLSGFFKNVFNYCELMYELQFNRLLTDFIEW